MKTKIKSKFDKLIDKAKPWKRVFVFLPVTTEDRFKIWFGHVWKRTTFSWTGPRVEYHTNPDGKEDEFQQRNLPGGIMFERLRPPPPPRMKPPPPPSPTPKVCEKCGTTDCIDQKEYLCHFNISSGGGMSVDSEVLAKTCNFRRQIKAADELFKKHSVKRTGSTGPR